MGPNTGGMGAYSPAPLVTDDLWPVIRREVFERTLAELEKRGITFKGVLYAGLMIEDGEIKVLEFNVRFGDPEIQCIVPRLQSDLTPVLEACIDGNLKESMLTWSDENCVCVVMAAGGYPGDYKKGDEIDGIADADELDHVTVFHAGTAIDDGEVVTAGGRVLGVTALGKDLEEAVDRVYEAVDHIHYDNAQFRADIAAKAFARREGP
jgi:phosphoribosylamine--glycine ligase